MPMFGMPCLHRHRPRAAGCLQQTR